MAFPPGPSLALLQSYNWITRAYPYLDECAAKYGDPFAIEFPGFGRFVLVSNPEAIKEIFLASPEVMRAGQGNEILRPVLGDNSLLLLDGEKHKRQRQLMTPPFHGARMRAYGDDILRVARERLSRWKAGEELSVHPTMQEISLEVILHAVFGVGDDPEYPRYKALLARALESLGSAALFIKALQVDLGPITPWGRYRDAAEQLERMLNAELTRRRETGLAERKDILSLMMSARDESGQPMTDTELREEAFTLLTAGHETTATALAWALFWIHSVPGVRERLVNELKALGENPTTEAVTACAYLDAVCQETLRLYPIIPIVARKLSTPFTVMGYELPAGATVAPCIYLTHRREDLYPEPTAFKPERFLARKFSPYEYLPFGGGVRRCIGAPFALYEMKLVLWEVMRRFELELDMSPEPRAVRRSVTLAPAEGTRVKVRRVLTT
ncbi:MAG: cytochrome P450 [Myxococcota bacterium]